MAEMHFRAVDLTVDTVHSGKFFSEIVSKMNVATRPHSKFCLEGSYSSWDLFAMMAFLGLWLWKDPALFGTANSCAIEKASTVILGHAIPAFKRIAHYSLPQYNRNFARVHF
ncbi:hypothetical protein B0H13DRAFT_1880518 [Mycena leptocephala]|nr:hypothetical protein B0H13DRAFT_1880518 [Mycena leptocephala]